MAETEWKGFLDYSALGKGSVIKPIDVIRLDFRNVKLLSSSGIPVSMFVGIGRTIFLIGTKNVSISNELGQAQVLESITLALEPDAALAVADLRTIHSEKLAVSIQFSVEKRVGKTLVEAFSLRCKDAEITKPPTTWATDGASQIVKFKIPKAQVMHGAFENNKFVEEEL